VSFDESFVLLKQAKDPKKLFGADPYKRYRELAKIVHPDTVPAAKQKSAGIAFALLGELYASLNGKAPVSHPKIIGKWAVGDALAKGDLCDLYHAFSAKTNEVVFKIVRDPNDNDLLAEEQFHLGRLSTDDNFRKYLPAVYDTLEASGRRANIVSMAEGYISLQEIFALHPNGGLDFRHIIWMVNRALSVLGFIAREEVVHGAVLPPHLLYHPVDHGLKLVDWCYAVTAESKKHVPVLLKEYKGLYPPEVVRKNIPQPSTDLYMLFNTIKSYTKVPKRFSALFDYCLVQSPNSRIGDAWEVQDRWAALAKEEYGPPKYLKLEIPVS
jgi:hypothetical protein